MKNNQPVVNGNGFNILLSVISIIVIIAIVIFVFVISLGEIKSSVSEQESGTNNNETILFTGGAGSQVSATGDNIQLTNVQVIRCGA